MCLEAVGAATEYILPVTNLHLFGIEVLLSGLISQAAQ